MCVIVLTSSQHCLQWRQWYQIARFSLTRIGKINLMNFCQSDLKYFPDETVATVTCLRLCTDEGQIWRARANPRSTLSCQISCECVHCVGFRWPKTTILGKFWLLGAPVATPFTDEHQIDVLEQAQSLHLYAKFHLNVFIVSTSGGQKNNFGQISTFGGSSTDPLLLIRAKFGDLFKKLSWHRHT